jgi:hypothetical protein
MWDQTDWAGLARLGESCTVRLSYGIEKMIHVVLSISAGSIQLGLDSVAVVVEVCLGP